MACFAPVRKASKTACCTEQSSCHKPAKKPAPHAHDDCQGLPGDIASGAPAPDLTKQLGFAEPAPAYTEIAAIPAAPEPPRETARPYYPPDLCLLNSQLTI